MAEWVYCVGGALHGQRVRSRGRKMSSPDGGTYYVVGSPLRGSRKPGHAAYYVHDTVYHDNRERKRLAIEVFYQMTWTGPSDPGYYWARWKPELDRLTIVDFSVTAPGRFTMFAGQKPGHAVHRHALWSAEAIPATAIQLLRGDAEVGVLIAADWCVENGFPADAAHFRELARDRRDQAFDQKPDLNR